MLKEQPQFEFQKEAESPVCPERRYKNANSEQTATRQNSQWAAAKAAGGAEYEAMLEKGRVARAKFRTNNRERYLELRRKHEKNTKPSFKTNLCARARKRGRERGLDATIRHEDLVWPTHCPVLGLELNYPERSGMRGIQTAQPNWPSLDRWDSTKGYVPGNVFVISYRANTLKNSATYEEILKVAKYLSRRPR